MFIFKFIWFIISSICRLIALTLVCLILARGANAALDDIKQNGLEMELMELKQMAVNGYSWITDNHQELIAQLNNKLISITSLEKRNIKNLRSNF